MVRLLEDEEIKRAMFSIDNDSAPGPDGYSSKFFKASWSIVGPDVCKAVKDFFGKRGLRQGDPMSPYLFTIVIEVLNLIIKRRIDEEGDFQYHPKCQSQKITHLCFADDLILFCHGDTLSASLIKEALDEFKEYSGLVPSIPKSTAFFSNVKQVIKNSILDIMPFEEGTLPVKYLGVPLISSRLLHKDCKVLVEKVKNKVGDWKNKSLSFAGRLQLIFSVISSMQVYWASIFILSASIIKDIEKITRGFLWCQGDMKRGKAKVSWETVCLPKNHGGIGLKSLSKWNNALMATNLWSIITKKYTLWVRWVHSYRLKDRFFWDVPIKYDSSWGWRKILQMREVLKDFVMHKLGNGKSTSAWFDKWHPNGPFSAFISKRNINDAGFNLTMSVNEVIEDGRWMWP
ncbi:putative RNA-directed DNA polymerase [Tanacetum coccineum]